MAHFTVAHVTDADYWRLREFLREAFERNSRQEHSWQVGDLDHWRWHLLENCRCCASLEQGTLLWQSDSGQIVAAVTDMGWGEIRLHVDPRERTAALEDELLAAAEARFTAEQNGRRLLYLPVREDDTVRQCALAARGYARREGKSRQWRRDLAEPRPAPIVPAGYRLRSMGEPEDHAARSLASWRAFHDDEPDDHYDGDYSWYANLQRAPLYRRDLDVVAVTDTGEIASFVTVSYDDANRSGVCVLVGTAAAHRRRGLARATMLEAQRRLALLGGTLLTVTGYDEQANAFCRTVFDSGAEQHTWLRVPAD